VHTAVPLSDRPLVVVNSEAIEEQGNEPLGYAGIVDISDETDPRLISLFPQPVPPQGLGVRNFYERLGRFGPHNQHQPQYQSALYQNENLVFLAYFNAGLRIYDSSPIRTTASMPLSATESETDPFDHLNSPASKPKMETGVPVSWTDSKAIPTFRSSNWAEGSRWSSACKSNCGSLDVID
jgi:hypothetical protein